MQASATTRPGVSRRQLLLHATAAPIMSLVLVSFLVIRASDAAFSDTTDKRRQPVDAPATSS